MSAEKPSILGYPEQFVLVRTVKVPGGGLGASMIIEAWQHLREAFSYPLKTSIVIRDLDKGEVRVEREIKRTFKGKF